MIEISQLASTIQPSGIRKFFDLVVGMKDVISLGVGEPDFDTPWNVCESAIHSIEQGFTSYTSNKGLKELRVAISHHLRHEHKIEYDPESEMLITVGVSEAFDLAIRAIINPGDEVIIPEPSFVAYGPVVTLAGGTPVFIKTEAANGYKLSPEMIGKACTKKTKAILINYPANPTGTSYTKRELEQLNNALKKHDLTVITDEVYCALSYDMPHTPWPALNGAKSKCIYLNGFSKAYAMTGWRVGYAAAPSEVIDAMTKIHQYTMMCVSTMGQIAALEAIQNGQKAVQLMVDEYKRRRQFVITSLNEMGFECNMPEGAFYAFPSIKASGMDSAEFANYLLQEEKVAVVPGTAFGPSGEGYIRISYASSMENLKEAMLRMGKVLKKTKK